MSERVPGPVTENPIKRKRRFRLPSFHAFLLTAIQLDGKLSIVTTEPNASVAPFTTA